ncbi:glycoside hydrolase family 61 protein [Phanerochaete sordida]|uniref:lytic cellulose monooxygenase (C4-dehydrogenating) n=1 Tax=Phanerochaete sordida TaxID=48140 RepID=A0A9P3LFP6_9APHY|nr:glycoside hydrolase family 61 protein [Phanerochaete sordida]
MIALSLIALATALGSSLLPRVAAHGYVQDVTIGGKNYPAWDPNVDPYQDPLPQRVMRKVPDDGPVIDITSPDMACNQGGESGAALVADAAAGSQVTFQMVRWPSDHLGPVIHYMADCEGDCTTFDATKGKWFKIYEDGFDNGLWATTKLIANNLAVTVTIPAELKSGQYLLRHELIALHDITQPQYYPACAQINVTGGGNQEPDPASIVSIPGVYSGFKWPDIWSEDFNSFALPSPALAKFAASAASSPAPAPSSQAPAPSTSSSPAPAPSSQAPAPSTTAAPAPGTSSAPAAAPAASSTGKAKCKARTTKRSASEKAARRARRHAAGHAKRHHQH